MIDLIYIFNYIKLIIKYEIDISESRRYHGHSARMLVL